MAAAAVPATTARNRAHSASSDSACAVLQTACSLLTWSHSPSVASTTNRSRRASARTVTSGMQLTYGTYAAQWPDERSRSLRYASPSTRVIASEPPTRMGNCSSEAEEAEGPCPPLAPHSSR